MEDNIDPTISDVGLLGRHAKFGEIDTKDSNQIQNQIDTNSNVEPDGDFFGLNYVEDLRPSPKHGNNNNSNNNNNNNNNNITNNHNNVNNNINNHHLNVDKNGENNINSNTSNNDLGGNHEDAATAMNIMNLSNFDFEHESAESPFVEYSDDDKERGGAVKLVQYNHGEKTKRLGRPRKHITSKLTPPENHSSSNYNESIVSKFRLDSQPIEGPGSRGGRQGARPTPRGRVTSNGSRKRKHQSSLSFTGEKKSLDNNESKSENDSNTKKLLILKLTLQAPKKEPKKKKQSLKLTTADKFKKSSGISRTTILRNKNKITRQLPGPLIGVYYDLYDENIMNRAKLDGDTENGPIEDEDDYKYRIAAGYKVKKAPFASDILYIVSFLNKFREVIQFDGIGPQSLEKGLSLPLEIPSDDYDPTYISEEMSKLFKRILTLVLNRKKEVVSHASAIMELRPMSQYLGMPKEWREDHLNEEDEELFSPVDPNSPEILLTRKSYYKYTSTVTYNPFRNNEFEANGLAGMPNPEDRLVLFRTLMQWCLTSSDAIKNYITQTVQAQDVPGDRETMYGARSILKGSKATEDAKKEAESKLAKRKSEEDTKYVDPTSNPLEHSLKLRLMEELVADCGYKVGRFYLCRMSNEANGGLTSLKKMESTWRDPSRMNTRPPSEFKLYVQDVHGMLQNALASYGVEFDDDSEEIVQDYEGEYWYEVASNTSELANFSDYIGKILGHIKSPNHIKTINVTSKIYLPLVNLRKYIQSVLPLLTRQESVDNIEDRNMRRKQVDYSIRRPLIQFMDENEEVQYPPDTVGDDDYEEVDDLIPGDDDDDYEYEDQ